MDLNIQGTIFKDVSGISKIDSFNYKLINYYRSSDIINAKINLNINYYDNNYDNLINYNEDVDFRVMLDDNIVLSTFQISDLKLETLENQGFNIIYQVSIEADRKAKDTVPNNFEESNNNIDSSSDINDNNIDNVSDDYEQTYSKVDEIIEVVNEEETIINEYAEKTEEKLSSYLKDRNKLSHIREEKPDDLIGELTETYSTYKIVFINEHTTKKELANKYDIDEKNIYLDSNNPSKAIININE